MIVPSNARGPIQDMQFVRLPLNMPFYQEVGQGKSMVWKPDRQTVTMVPDSKSQFSRRKMFVLDHEDRKKDFDDSRQIDFELENSVHFVPVHPQDSLNSELSQMSATSQISGYSSRYNGDFIAFCRDKVHLPPVSEVRLTPTLCFDTLS
jgi:hypothetical protein